MLRYQLRITGAKVRLNVIITGECLSVHFSVKRGISLQLFAY